MAYLIKVWDLPTRLFHWALVLLMLGSVISVLVFENMVWHANCGYGLTALWLFRLLWGVVGGHWSRFRQMFFTWRQYVNYVRQASSWPLPGHNPLGSLSVFALLLVLGLQMVSGLASDDDAGFNGPLTVFLSNTWVAKATFYHAEIGKWVLLFWVTLHLLAIAYHEQIHLRRLVKPMFNGFQWHQHESQASQDGWRHRLLGLFVCVLCAVGVYVGLQFAQGFTLQ